MFVFCVAILPGIVSVFDMGKSYPDVVQQPYHLPWLITVAVLPWLPFGLSHVHIIF